MAPLVRTYPTPDAARQAVEELRAAGVQARHIRLLTSEPLRAAGQAVRGSFAGPVGPGAVVGAFAGRPHRLGQARGSFATGSVKGDPDSRRKGSFADVERVAIITYQGDTERSRVSGYRGIRLLLRRSALDDSTIDQTVNVLHKRHSVVLVDAAGLASGGTGPHFRRAVDAA